MNLQVFIKETLVQIMKGVEEADKELEGSEAIVCPKSVYPSTSENEHIFGYIVGDENTKQRLRRAVQRVDFDVAVYASEGTETKGGIGIMVGTIGLGSHGKTDKGQRSESRIKFSVPVVFPNRR